MRRRLLGDSSIPDVYATFVQHMDAQPGDVVFYNTKTNGRSYYRLDEGDDLIPKTCVPIGIIAIPVGNEFYPSSDICSAISLCHMSSKDVQGDITPEEIMWGDDTVDVNANWQIIDGKITTQMILDIRGDIGGDIDFDNPSHYPAASSCNAYYTVGTKPGDWYLPSYYELVYGIPSNIDEVLSKLRDIYGEYKIMEYLPLDLYGWTSNDYGAKFAFATWMLTQECFGKTARCYVVAFTQLSSNLERNYGDILISGGNTTDIPASGGSSQVTGYTYSQTYGYGDSTTNGGTITSGAEISVTSVSGDNLGTTETERTKKGESVLTVTMNGKTATKSWDVYQEENKATYGDISIVSNGSASDIPARGGTINASGGSGTQTITYTSTVSRAGTVTCGTYSDVSASTLSTTLKDRTKIGNSTATLTGEGGKTATVSVDVYQLANTRNATSTRGGTMSYEDVVVGGFTWSANTSIIPASGGKVTVTPSKGTQKWSKSATITTYTYTSRSTKDETTADASSGTYTDIPVSPTSHTFEASSKGTITSDQTTVSSVKFTWTSQYNNASATSTQTCYQQGNSRWSESTYNGSNTYGNITVGSPSGGGTFAASGGSATYYPTNGSQSYTYPIYTRYRYTSGSYKDEQTSTGSGSVAVAPNPTSWSASCGSKGESASGVTTVKTQTVTWAANGKSAKATGYAYQAANSFSSCSVSCSTSASSVSRLGGSITVSGSATVKWSSGSYTKTPSSLISDQNAGASISGSTITFGKNSTTSSRYAYARNYISYNGSIYYSDAKKISQKGKVGDITFTFSYNNSNYTCTVKASKAPGSTVSWTSTGIFKDSSGGLIYDGSASGSFSPTATISTGTWNRAKDGWMSWYGWGSKYLVQSGNENYDFKTA